MALGTEELLRGIPLFMGLATDELSPLAARCRRRRFPANESLFHEGDVGQTLYLILSGFVRIERITPDGAIVLLARRGPGEHLGEMALLDDQPRSADAVTDTPCDLLMLDRRDLIGFIESHPSTAWTMVRSLSSRLREVSDRLLALETQDVLGRIAVCLLDLAERLPATASGSVRIDDLSDSRLAQRVGATRETVNRRLARLRQLGVVSRDGSALLLHNLDKLRSLAQ